MSRKLRLAAVLAVLAFACGCMEVTTVVTVSKDGSGTITETMYMSAAIQQMMTGMGGGGDVKITEQPIDIAKYKAKVTKMGEGVIFVSAEKVKREDGAAGEKVVYSFDDITKIKLQSAPEKPGPGGAPGGQTSKKPQSISFGFVKGNPAKLTMNIPQRDTPEDAEETVPAVAPPAGTPSAKELAQMKQMFGGFRFRIMVKVDGAITKTNASFVDGNVVTVLDMNIGELLENEEQFKKLAAMGPIQDMETAKKLLKDFPGLKIETEQKVHIEFK